MDVLVCGTAAAEAWPALCCHCEACAEARRRGGKDIRSRSGYMIGEEIRIDFGPDSLHHSFRYGLAYEKLKHLLVSHSHEDHWTPHELTYRRSGFSLVPEEEVLNIYCNDKVVEKAHRVMNGEWEKFRLRFTLITPFEPVELEPGIVATPLRAAHDPKELCVNWLVETPGGAFLQGHDTGWWDDEVWEFLKGKRLDAVVMDCTHGSIDHDRNHMGASGVVRAQQKLAEQGSLTEGCRFYATHFSHNGKWLHADLEAYFAPHGIGVTHDGLRIPLKGSALVSWYVSGR